MTRVLHVIEQLSLGGAARSHIAVAKYSSRVGEFHHAIASLLPACTEAVELARAAGLEVLSAPERSVLVREMGAADVVHVGWWNNPRICGLLRSDLPPMRLCVWLHVAGDQPPQVVTEEIVDYADLVLAACPHTLRTEAIRRLSDDERAERTALVYDAADFERLVGLAATPHTCFNVGYIGTLDFQKIHPRFVHMCAAIEVPGVRFVLCGDDPGQLLCQQAEALGCVERFDFRGYVPDVRPILGSLDVFGYPLCEDTYAAGELVLQEAMFAGIPPVVFPWGGLRDLVVPDFTGLVVSSEREYAQAVEYLYRHPVERSRLGRNAREYAGQIFGAENAARALDEAYQLLLRRPKRVRAWGCRSGAALLAQPISLADVIDAGDEREGAARFVAGLGRYGEPFRASLAAPEDREEYPEDEQIACSSELLFAGAGGIRSFRNHYPEDPWLRFWSGLVLRERGQAAEAVAEFVAARKAGIQHWRVALELASAAAAAGQWSLARRVLAELRSRPTLPAAVLARLEELETEPDFVLLEDLRQRVADGDLHGVDSPLAELASRYPHSPDVLNACAEFRIAGGEGEHGVALLGELVKRWPDHPGILNNLAVVRWLDGEREAALSFLESAATVAPDDPTIVSNLAEFARAG